jgi:hypothetical protein
MRRLHRLRGLALRPNEVLNFSLSRIPGQNSAENRFPVPGLSRTRKLEIHIDVYGVYQDLEPFVDVPDTVLDAGNSGEYISQQTALQPSIILPCITATPWGSADPG